MRFINEGNALVCYHNGEMLRIEAWGRDALRVRSTMQHKLQNTDWALSEAPSVKEAVVTIEEEDHWVGDGTIDKRQVRFYLGKLSDKDMNGVDAAITSHLGYEIAWCIEAP